jgi:hypothetical protein
MKKYLVLGVSIGAGAVLAIAAVLCGMYWHNHPSTQAKDWPTLKEAVGINMKLRTELARGRLLYQFAVWPVAADLSPAFGAVANGSGYAKQFTVAFYDAGGFELCSETITNLTTIVDEKGSVEAMTSTGELPTCPASDYRRASSWNVSYAFPSLTTLAADLEKLNKMIADAPPPKAARKGGFRGTISDIVGPVNRRSHKAAFAVVTDGSNIMSEGRVTVVFMKECPGVRVVKDTVSEPYGPRGAGYRVTTDSTFNAMSPDKGAMRVYGADGVTIYSGSGSLETVVKGACSAIQAQQGTR